MYLDNLTSTWPVDLHVRKMSVDGVDSLIPVLAKESSPASDTDGTQRASSHDSSSQSPEENTTYEPSDSPAQEDEDVFGMIRESRPRGFTRTTSNASTDSVASAFHDISPGTADYSGISTDANTSGVSVIKGAELTASMSSSTSALGPGIFAPAVASRGAARLIPHARINIRIQEMIESGRILIDTSPSFGDQIHFGLHAGIAILTGVYVYGRVGDQIIKVKSTVSKDASLKEPASASFQVTVGIPCASESIKICVAYEMERRTQPDFITLPTFMCEVTELTAVVECVGTSSTELSTKVLLTVEAQA